MKFINAFIARRGIVGRERDGIRRASERGCAVTFPLCVVDLLAGPGFPVDFTGGYYVLVLLSAFVTV